MFACVKVQNATTDTDGTASLHPLRFTFQTGGVDGIYFPMKLTSLQSEPFAVNLYVFYRAWLNDNLTKHGYVQRGFTLKYRDWDSPECEPNGGKNYSAPQEDPFLRSASPFLPTVTRLFQKLHPGERYYLTNIQAHQLNPADVRQWQDDLWLFPYYTKAGRVPHDARPGGVASASWPNDIEDDDEDDDEGPLRLPRRFPWLVGAGAVLAGCVIGGACWWWRRTV